MFVTRRRFNQTIEAYQSEVKHYRDTLDLAAREHDIYRRELEAIRDRLDRVLPRVSVTCSTTS